MPDRLLQGVEHVMRDKAGNPKIHRNNLPDNWKCGLQDWLEIIGIRGAGYRMSAKEWYQRFPRKASVEIGECRKSKEVVYEDIIDQFQRCTSIFKTKLSKDITLLELHKGTLVGKYAFY